MPRRRLQLPAALAGVLLAALPLLTGPAAAQRPPGDPVSVLGGTRLTARELVETYRASGHEARLTVPLARLARLFVEEGRRYGVRADLAWAQSLVETGWFAYPDYGQVHWTDNNFAGIGAYDGGAHGFGYPSARTGVRAQMQLLRAYAQPEPVPDAIVSPPRSFRGIAPSWLDMGNGRWATSTRYSQTVLTVYGRLLDAAGKTLESRSVRVRDPRAPRPAAVAREGDGLWLAGADGQVYDVGDARFWGSAASRALTAPPAAVVPSRAAEGYLLVLRNGAVAAFGDARDRGSAIGRLLAPVAAAVATPTGKGYWIVSEAGEVAAFGDAAPIAPTPGAVAAGVPVVAAAAAPSGGGLWLADAAGHVLPAGDAAPLGDLTGREAPGTDPVTGLAARPAGDGYWLVRASGQVDAFGAAGRHGGLAGETPVDGVPAAPVVDVAPTPTGGGYWLVTAAGWVAGRGDAADFGAGALSAPVTAVASRAATPAG